MTGGRGLRVAAAVLALGLLGACADRSKSSGVDGKLTVNPAGVHFERVAVFDGRDVQVSVRNVGRANLMVEEAYVEGAEGIYLARLRGERRVQLAPGQESQLQIRFTPLRPGDFPGTLVLRTDSGVEPLVRVPLSGTGVDAIARVSPSALDFGRIEADSEKTLQLTLVNPSELPVQVTPKVLGKDKKEFFIDAVELAPFETRQLPLRFAPVTVGRKQVSLAITPCRGCGDVVVAVAAEAAEQAVVAEPPVLDFGPVPLDRDAFQTVTLRNVTTEPATLTGYRVDGTDAGFSLPAGPGAFPLTLGPGETRQYQFRFAPGHQGWAQDMARFEVVSKRHPTTNVGLQGHGGAPELCISPASYDYGNQPVGSRTGVTVRVKNCGSGNGGPMVLQSFDFDGSGADDGQFNFQAGTFPRSLLPGEETTLRVFYEPLRDGDHSTVFRLTSSAYNGNGVRMSFRGNATVRAPCDLAVTPLAVDFGTIQPGRGAVLGVKLENRGSDVCAVKNMRLADDAGGVFNMPGGALDGFVIPPGNFFSFQIGVAVPSAGGVFDGMLQVEQANPATPRVLVPLRVNGQTSCLVAQPRYVDFGVARADCPPDARQVNFSNVCSEAVTVNGVRIGAGTTDGEFVLTRAPATFPRTLSPGESFSVEVDYEAQVPGMNLSPLFAEVVGLPAPVEVSLVGESSSRVEKTDRFVQTDGRKVDVLFVVDNTASMVEEQPRFARALPAFADAAAQAGVDLHAAVTTTGIQAVSNACPGGAQGGEAGRFFPADNSNERLFTATGPTLGGELQQNANVGQCAIVEQGFEAVRRALSDPLVSRADDTRTSLPNDGNAGFLRADATLLLVFVGDEDDNSPDEVETYVRFLQTKKGETQPQRVTAFAIAPTASVCGTAGGSGARYAELARRTGGEVLDICAPDYAPLLRTVANRAFNPQDRFPLSQLPEVASIEVRVDGVLRTSGWSYDRTGNAIVFGTMPPPGAAIEVFYRRACP